MQQQPFGGEQKWELEKDEMDRMAKTRHEVNEAKEADAANAAESGGPVATKKPWWRFWES